MLSRLLPGGRSMLTHLQAETISRALFLDATNAPQAEARFQEVSLYNFLVGHQGSVERCNSNDTSYSTGIRHVATLLYPKPHQRLILTPSGIHFWRYGQGGTVRLQMGAYYIDGPVFLKSGVNFYGDWRDDDPPYATWLYLHDIATSASVDGIVNGDGVKDVTVRCKER